MALPLSPLPSKQLNWRSPPIATEGMDTVKSPRRVDENGEILSAPSSPRANLSLSPLKLMDDTVIKRSTGSPLRPSPEKRIMPEMPTVELTNTQLTPQRQSLGHSEENDSQWRPPVPEHRQFDTAPSSPQAPSFHVEQMLADDEEEAREEDDTIASLNTHAENTIMDDTQFSNFSAVPNVDMNRFAQGDSHSPMKSSYRTPNLGVNLAAFTPRTSQISAADGSEALEASPTPRNEHFQAEDHNLLDFTGEHNFSATPIPPGHRPFRLSPLKGMISTTRRSPTKSATQPNLAAYARVPSASPDKLHLPPSTPSEMRSRAMTNLLDFDLPPPPTPMSMPSITPRELESLKSGFLSEISSLRATLMGRDAEVSSLKQANGDAERRVGEAMEQMRDLKGQVEGFVAEKRGWESRGREMEKVLKGVKDEILREEKEKELLQTKVDEAEKREDRLACKLAEKESQIAGLTKGLENAHNWVAPSAQAGKDGGDGDSPARNTAREVEAAVEKVARELHGLYKSKHETKVTALKKSYEARWEKKVRSLETRVSELERENEELRLGRDATMSGVIGMEQLRAKQLRDDEGTARAQELEAEIQRLEDDNRRLKQDVEAERAEKGELVRAVDEMLELQQMNQSVISSSSSAAEPTGHYDHQPCTSTSPQKPTHSRSPSKHAQAQTASPSKRASLVPATAGASRLGANSSRRISTSNPIVGASGIGRPSGMPRPGSGIVGGGGFGYGGAGAGTSNGMGRVGASRSGGMMGNIERMGRGGGMRGGL